MDRLPRLIVMLVIAALTIFTVTLFGKIQCEKLKKQYEDLQTSKYEEVMG